MNSEPQGVKRPLAGDHDPVPAFRRHISESLPAKPITRLDDAIVKQTLDPDAYHELEVDFEDQEKILWYGMRSSGRPSYTVGMLQEIRHLQESVRSIFRRSPDSMGAPIKYMVLHSHMPKIFNLGGDLTLFSRLIRQKNRRALQKYAHLAISAVHANAVNLDLPVITVSLVEGDALGGGFEAAVSSNLLIAESGTRFGLPEILFNLFPGMGAYSLLSRKIAPAKVEEMIFGGKIYEAEELHELGVVDAVCDPGYGREFVYNYIERNEGLHSAHSAIYKVRNRVNPVEYSEMIDIGDIWVEAALSLSDNDLRRMERLAGAQDRRWNRIQAQSEAPNLSAVTQD